MDLPDLTKADIKKALSKQYSDQVEKLFGAFKAMTLAIDSVRPSTVFESYNGETGFFSGEGKKDQFPDAFIFECLKGEAHKDTPLIIVSNDDDFDAPSQNEEHISRAAARSPTAPGRAGGHLLDDSHPIAGEESAMATFRFIDMNAG